MNDERILGRLEEFKEWASKEFQETKEELKELKAQLADLQKFRWKVAGVAASVGAAISFLIELAKR